MDTNFDKKIFIKNFRENCNKIQIKKIIEKCFPKKDV